MNKRLPVHRRAKHQIQMFVEILTNSVGMLFHSVFFLILAFFKNEDLAYEKEIFDENNKTCKHPQHTDGQDWRI
ncbi:MAG: hypothetical protein RBR47_09340 [Bacteroidales bacterium]|jgi:hypothetical protein|nr:hypothetical protein [Bacteroidales bacterium]